MPSYRPRLVALLLGVTITAGSGWADAPTAAAEDLLPVLVDEPLPVADSVPDPASVSDPPDGVVVADADRTLTVHWSPPASDGGSSILGYRIDAVPATSEVTPPPAVTAPATAARTSLSSLVNGVTYTVRVRAINSAGASVAAAAAGTPRTVPGAPTIRAVRAGDHAAAVRWAAPASTGGAPLLSFVVRAAPSGKTVRVGAGATSTTLRGLANGATTTFTVTATNVAGSGRRSASSNAVVPRAPARLVPVRQPARSSVYGTPSSVRARLVRPNGTGAAAQRVHLLAKVRPSSSWRRMGTGLTGTRGGITLRTVLPATAALRLHHPASTVTAERLDLRSVQVARRVTARASRSSTRVGMPLVVRGRVAPAQREGSRVHLQRRASGSWRRIATGRMTTRRHYRIRWSAQQTGRHPVRVVVPGKRVRAAGVSRRWRHRINPENAADIASDILHDRDITLATVHLSAGSDGASARNNIVDVAAGRRSECSSGCGLTSLNLRLLRAVREMGRRGTITVSEFSGGNHASGSAHYSGDAVDITWVNGRHVGYGTNYGMVVNQCRRMGARQVLTPSNDPWGGHADHVHCGW